MIVVALAVIALTLVAGRTAGALLGLALLVVAAVFAWRWIRDALGAPDEDPRL